MRVQTWELTRALQSNTVNQQTRIGMTVVLWLLECAFLHMLEFCPCASKHAPYICIFSCDKTIWSLHKTAAWRLWSHQRKLSIALQVLCVFLAAIFPWLIHPPLPAQSHLIHTKLMLLLVRC